MQFFVASGVGWYACPSVLGEASNILAVGLLLVVACVIPRVVKPLNSGRDINVPRHCNGDY